MKYEINPQFESCIPDLMEEEYQQLEENILQQGEVIEPIILWNGFVVDGHHRLRIVEKHPEVTYHTKELPFNDDASVINWICKNQLGRRNLTPEQRRFLMGNYYGTEKAGRGGKRSNVHDEGGRFATKSHDDTLRSEEKESEDTAERIAKEQHVSRASVLRAEVFYKAVNLAENFFPGVKHRILHGDLELRQADAERILKAPAEQQRNLVEALLFPQAKEQSTETKTAEVPAVQNTHPDNSRETTADNSAGVVWTVDDNAEYARKYAAKHSMNLSALQESCYLAKALDLGEKIVPGFRDRFLREGYRFHQKDAERIVHASPKRRPEIVKRMWRHSPKEVTLDVDGLFDDIWRCAPAISEKDLQKRWTSMLNELTKPFSVRQNKARSRVLAKIAISYFRRYLN